MLKLESVGRQWQVLGAALSQTLGVTLSVFSRFEVDDNSTEIPLLDDDLDWDAGSIGSAIIVDECVPPSIDEFPNDLFTLEQRQHGAVLVHVLVVAYICCMLAIVCDRYFVPSLEVITEYLNVPTDIAGATFMAIGTSSPELFSSVIGAFIAKGDIGVGTVVGSAVFNLLAVTGASGLAIGAVAHLEWYPITRDCLVYVITVASMVIVIHDNIITWIEALCLLLMFCCYLILLFFNQRVKKASCKTVENVKIWWYSESKNVEKEGLVEHSLDDESTPLFFGQKSPNRFYSYDDSACPSSETPSPITHSQGSSSGSETLANEAGDYDDSSQVVRQLALPLEYEVFEDEYDVTTVTQNASSAVAVVIEQNPEAKTISLEIKSKSDFEESERFSLFRPPPSYKKIFWFVMWPANLVFQLTIPRCYSLNDIKWFPVTFMSSIMWLGILSYLSFWMVATIGYTLGIPDTVSGITILAAGTSVPELVASVIVVRNGLPNMAISNLVSSNVFDILFCLGLPWLIKALINTDTRTVVINSSALTYTTLILLSTVVLFYVALLCFRWRFSWRVGIVSLCLYVVFLVLASLYESNVFGDFNPPTCNSVGS